MFYIMLFIQGIMSFFHPCVFSMLPIYLGYITGGLNVEDDNYKKEVTINTLLFMLGVWTTFLILSIMFSILGVMFSNFKDYLIIFGGLFIFVFGLHQLDVIHVRLFDMQPNINKDKITHTNKYISSFLLGLTISFSWTPCVGPVLSSILVLITIHGQILTALLQMFVYVLGWSIPFVLIGLFSVKFLTWFNNNDKFMKYVKVISGIIILTIGLYLVFAQAKTIYYKNTLDDIYNKVYTTNKEELSLSNLYDEKVIIFFLDSGCGACVEEVDHINELQSNNKDINIIAIVKSKSYPKDFINKLNVITIHDKDLELWTYFDIEHTPSYLLLNEYGQVKKRFVGMFDEKVILKELKQIK